MTRLMIDGEEVIIPFPAQPETAGHAGYLKLLDELRDLHRKKSADYGRGRDPFANMRAAQAFGIAPWIGAMIRANDKMHRIQSFIQDGSLANESVEDSLKDLAAYALIALTLYRDSPLAPVSGERGRGVTRS